MMAERAVADPSLLPKSRENAGEAARRFAARALANRRQWKMTAGIMRSAAWECLSTRVD